MLIGFLFVLLRFRLVDNFNEVHHIAQSVDLVVKIVDPHRRFARSDRKPSVKLHEGINHLADRFRKVIGIFGLSGIRSRLGSFFFGRFRFGGFRVKTVVDEA